MPWVEGLRFRGAVVDMDGNEEYTVMVVEVEVEDRELEFNAFKKSNVDKWC